MLRLWMADANPGQHTWLVGAPLASAFGFVGALGAGIGLRARLDLPRLTPAALGQAARTGAPDYVLLGSLAGPVRLDRRTRQRAVIRAWQPGNPVARWNPLVVTGLGAPFAAGLLVCPPINGPAVPGSLGVPLPGVSARIVDETGQPCPAGSLGDMEVRAPNTLAPDRWLKALAGARMDDRGYVYSAAPAEERALSVGQDAAVAHRAEGTSA
jgi:hypothetical protein